MTSLVQMYFQDKENGLSNLVKNGILESAEKALYKKDGIFEVRISGILKCVKWDTVKGCWVIENVSGSRWYPLEFHPRILTTDGVEAKTEQEEKNRKQGECVICEGHIKWKDVLIQVRGEQYCEVCFQEQAKEGTHS